MSLLSPQRDNKLKTTIIQTNKVTKSPPSITRTNTNTFATSKVVPSYMRQSPTQNPEGKKIVQQKQPIKVKVQNTSIKDLQNKLGQLDSKLAHIRQPQKLESPTSKKKQQAKIQTKKSSVQAVKKKPEVQVQSPVVNNPYRKDLIRKTCPDVVKAFETSKMLVSPSDMLINPRMTADNVQKAKMTKMNTCQVIDVGPPRNSFKMNNPQVKRIQNNKHLKSNQHSQKNVVSPVNQDSGKMRVTMSNKLLPKGPQKKPILSNFLDLSKGQHKSQECRSDNTPSIQTSNILNFTGLQNVEHSMLKQKKKVYQSSTSSSTIFPSNTKLGLPSARNNVSVPVISKKQFSKQSNQVQLKIHDFQIIKPLGSGKFSQVFLAVHRKTGLLFAIKQISKQKVKRFNMVRQVTDQIKLHSCLNHPNIIKFYALLQDPESLYLILQYVEGGSLFDQLALKSKLSFKQTAVYLKDVISAIQYLHQKSIAHRDIKPQNILIGMNCVAKICDLGWSAVILTSRKTYCGTFDYVPPEILQKKDYDLSVDIWCLGVLTYQLLTGKVPYQGDKHTVVMSKINNAQIFYPQQSQQFPAQAKQYIQLLLQHNPQQRPKSKHLLQHKFFDVTKLPTPISQVSQNAYVSSSGNNLYISCSGNNLNHHYHHNSNYYKQ